MARAGRPGQLSRSAPGLHRRTPRTGDSGRPACGERRRRHARAMKETVRAAQTGDLEALAAIWSVGWHDGHDGHTPEELIRARTEASFRDRAATRIGDTTLAEVDGTVAGFVVVRADEVEQIYVAAEHRGTGLAVRLLQAAAGIVAGGGHRRAWL